MYIIFFKGEEVHLHDQYGRCYTQDQVMDTILLIFKYQYPICLIPVLYLTLHLFCKAFYFVYIHHKLPVLCCSYKFSNYFELLQKYLAIMIIIFTLPL